MHSKFWFIFSSVRGVYVQFGCNDNIILFNKKKNCLFSFDKHNGFFKLFKLKFSWWILNNYYFSSLASYRQTFIQFTIIFILIFFSEFIKVYKCSLFSINFFLTLSVEGGKLFISSLTHIPKDENSFLRTFCFFRNNLFSNKEEEISPKTS